MKSTKVVTLRHGSSRSFLHPKFAQRSDRCAARRPGPLFSTHSLPDTKGPLFVGIAARVVLLRTEPTSPPPAVPRQVRNDETGGVRSEIHSPLEPVSWSFL